VTAHALSHTHTRVVVQHLVSHVKEFPYSQLRIKLVCMRFCALPASVAAWRPWLCPVTTAMTTTTMPCDNCSDDHDYALRQPQWRPRLCPATTAVTTTTMPCDNRSDDHDYALRQLQCLQCRSELQVAMQPKPRWPVVRHAWIIWDYAINRRAILWDSPKCTSIRCRIWKIGSQILVLRCHIPNWRYRIWDPVGSSLI